MSNSPRPNLFVIGAMKSGTTSLHSYLGAHPDVFMSDPIEPSYFVERSQLNWPVIDKMGFWRGESFYLEIFKSAGNARFIGESSTAYTMLPLVTGVPERLAAFSPDARLIYIMRDPIERCISHYWNWIRNQPEERGILEAIEQDPRYTSVSYYAMQPEPYLKVFGRERLTTLTFEELIANPAEAVQKVYAWLGIDSSFVPTNIDQAFNVTPERVPRVRGRGLVRRVWPHVRDLIPAPVKPAVRAAAEWLTTDPVDRGAIPRKEIEELLRPTQQAQTEELSDLLGRSFPEWKTLYDTRA